jgi:membrane-associated phospholipid phosphatase
MTTGYLILNGDVFCYIGGMGSVRIVALCLVLLATATSTMAEEPLTISRAWDDLGGWLTAPLHSTTTGWVAGVGSLGLTSLCYGYDRQWEDSIYALDNHRGWHNAAETATFLGNRYVVAGSIGTLGIISLLSNSRPLEEETWALGETVVYTSVLGEALKKGSGRARPTQSKSPYDFHGPSLSYDAFPSGHAILAGSLAGCLIRRHPVPEVIIPVSVAALAVGASRVVLGKHWPSDVVAGLAIGFCSGWTLGRPHKNIDYGFWFDGKGAGAQLSVIIQ